MDCKDRVGMCEAWKSNGACELGKVFYPEHPDEGYFSDIQPVEMMNFMNAACLGTCNRCGSKVISCFFLYLSKEYLFKKKIQINVFIFSKYL